MSESNFDNEEKLQEENEEIEFDDNIDIEALQAQLQQHMSEEGVDYVPDTPVTINDVEEASNQVVPVEFVDNDENNSMELDSFVQSVTDDNQNQQETNIIPQEQEDFNLTVNPPKSDEKQKLLPGEKKYIIYINPENIDFIEAMTINERKKIINRLLKEEDATLKKNKMMRERAKFINQVIIMVITVVVSLPIFFILLNKSIEVTILNYQQSQQNFVKLYKEQGKIKSYKKFQKTFD